jgi:N-acyl-D-amino-acid deacylase
MVRALLPHLLLAFALVPTGCDPAPSSPPDAAPEATADTAVAGGHLTDPPPLTTPAEQVTGPYQWAILGGEVIDGTGRPARRADLLIQGQRIAHIGIVDPDTLEIQDRYDATGKVLTPGFIDAHAHGAPLDNPQFSNFLAMGVTTILLGQDGGGPAAQGLSDHLDMVDEARPSVNVAYLLGHNSLRRESGVEYAPPSPEGSQAIAELVALGMDAGAFGISTGLEYDPGVQADLDELAAIAEPVGQRGGVVMSHMRNEDEDQVEASVEELLEQGRRSGAHVHASHLKIVLGSDTTQAQRILDSMDQARQEGLRVTGDVYPYTASFTGVAILFPDWARPPNDYGAVVSQRRGELAEHLRTRVEGRNGPEATLFGAGELNGFGALAGHTLAEVAEATERPFEEILIELGPGGARAAYFVMDERVMTTFLRDPHIVVSSDGSPTMAHPRGYGSFPLVIRAYAVESQLLPLEEVIRKMTGLTASIIGLDDPDRVELPRGVLRTGWAADIAVFEPGSLRDRARFDAPHILAEGMDGVWVGGQRAWDRAGPTPGPGRGRTLRASY